MNPSVDQDDSFDEGGNPSLRVDHQQMNPFDDENNLLDVAGGNHTPRILQQQIGPSNMQSSSSYVVTNRAPQCVIPQIGPSDDQSCSTGMAANRTPRIVQHQNLRSMFYIIAKRSPSAERETRRRRLNIPRREHTEAQIWTVLHYMSALDLLEPYEPRISNQELVNRAVREGRHDVFLGSISLPGLYRCSSMHDAVRDGRMETIHTLVAYQANIEATTVTGRTALHWAAEDGNYAAVRTLIEAGARVDTPSIFGITPLEEARYSGHIGICNTLEDYF